MRIREAFLAIARLAVVGAGTVLALEMLGQQLGLDRLELRRKLERHLRQVRNALDGDGDFDRLQQVLYGWDEEAESNALEVHIHHLRKKLFPELIRTVRGVGYLVDKA